MHADAKSSHAMQNSKDRSCKENLEHLLESSFLHVIYHFEAREVRSPMLQTVHNLELKRGSYGHLKANAQS